MRLADRPRKAFFHENVRCCNLAIHYVICSIFLICHDILTLKRFICTFFIMVKAGSFMFSSFIPCSSQIIQIPLKIFPNRPKTLIMFPCQARNDTLKIGTSVYRQSMVLRRERINQCHSTPHHQSQSKLWLSFFLLRPDVRAHASIWALRRARWRAEKC